MLPIVINIFFLKINVIQTGSALNIGENYLGEWSSVSKVNSGTGSLYGDQSAQNISDVCLDDADLFDLPVLKETSGSKIPDCLRGENNTCFSSQKAKPLNDGKNYTLRKERECLKSIKRV